MAWIKWLFVIAFFAWGLPLAKYRTAFRKIVYNDNSWTIAIKPYFIKETKALFGNIYPNNTEYLKMRNFYRKYLAIYTALFVLYLLSKKLG